MTEPNVISTLSMLSKIGPTLRADLVSLVPGCNLPLLLSMESDGYLRRHDGDPDVVTATAAGMRLIGIQPAKVKARTTSVMSGETYDSAELKPFTGRTGCNDAFALPSRYMNELRYRNGKVEKIG